MNEFDIRAEFTDIVTMLMFVAGFIALVITIHTKDKK